MWVVVCDDNDEFGMQITNTLNEILSSDDQLTFFNSGIELIAAANRSEHPMDLVLLDIEMPGLSGIETARELREINPGTVIVIVTGFIQYALKCYKIRAFNYMLKPIDPIELKSTIDEVRERINHTHHKKIHIETKDTNIFIPLADVLYIESFHRALYAHTRGSSYKYYEKISQVDKELTGSGFCRIHKSYIVNVAHIKKIDKASLKVVLYTGEELPIGKRNIKKLLFFFMDAKMKD